MNTTRRRLWPIITGAALAIAGLWLYLRTAANNNLCHTWVGAFAAKQCSYVEIAHSLGTYAVCAGVALAGWGIYTRRKRAS